MHLQVLFPCPAPTMPSAFSLLQSPHAALVLLSFSSHSLLHKTSFIHHKKRLQMLFSVVFPSPPLPYHKTNFQKPLDLSSCTASSWTKITLAPHLLAPPSHTSTVLFSIPSYTRLTIIESAMRPRIVFIFVRHILEAHVRCYFIFPVCISIQKKDYQEAAAK